VGKKERDVVGEEEEKEIFRFMGSRFWALLLKKKIIDLNFIRNISLLK